MTARFRSSFFGSSGFVAARPAARVVDGRRPGDRPVVEQSDAIVPLHGVDGPAKSSGVLAA